MNQASEPATADALLQNLYLPYEAIGAGTCAVAAYHQQLMDRLIRVDGQKEFALYLAPAGKLKSAAVTVHRAGHTGNPLANWKMAFQDVNMGKRCCPGHLRAEPKWQTSDNCHEPRSLP